MFEPKKFTIPKLTGISEKAIEEHVKLYLGYVKNANTILEHIEELVKDSEKYAYELGELMRRFSFEFNGMRNHEYYFHSLEGGSQTLSDQSALKAKIEVEWSSFENFLTRFKTLALTRGVGWAMLSYDARTNRLFMHWVDEQHLGHLLDTTVVLALDMWEHSYLFDYVPADKKKYVEAFFENLNWTTIEENFLEK